MRNSSWIRVCIIIFTVILLFAAAATADEEEKLYTAEDFVYKLNENDEAIITSYTGKEKVLNIPEQLEGHTVVELGSRCFQMNDSLNEAYVPSSVQKMADRVFANCSKLKKVELAEGVTSIGLNCFFCCYRLKELNFPDSVTFIGSSPLAMCSQLKSVTVSADHPYFSVVDGVLFTKPDHRIIWYPESKKDKEYTIPDGTEIIEGYTFAYCRAKSITIPDSVEKINPYAFIYCQNLTSFRMPPKVTEFDRGIVDCKKLQEITVSEENKCFKAVDGVLYQTVTHSLVYFPVAKQISEFVVPEDVEEICGAAFSKSKIKSIVFNNNLKHIGVDAFIDCDNLTEIILPEGLTYLNSFSFAYCDKLKKVTLPSTLERFTANPFQDSQKIETFEITKNGEHVAVIDNFLISLDDGRLISYPAGAKEKDVTIPASVKIIERESFYNQKQMKTLMIPEGVEAIRYRSFMGCKNLKKVYLPQSITNIDRSAFCTDDSLKKYIDAVYVVHKGSFAESYCQAYGLKTEYAE